MATAIGFSEIDVREVRAAAFGGIVFAMCAATKADFDRVGVNGILAGLEPTCFKFARVLDTKTRELTINCAGILNP